MSIVTCFGDTMFTKQNELTSSLKFGYVFDPEAFLCIHTRNGDRREVPLEWKSMFVFIGKVRFLEVVLGREAHANNSVS